MAKTYAVYKGLQKPLVYKGFKGKYIYWGVGFLVLAMVIGAIIMAAISKLIGVIVLAGIMGGGLWYTAQTQKKGLYNKTRNIGIYIIPSNLKNIYRYGKKRKI